MKLNHNYNQYNDFIGNKMFVFKTKLQKTFCRI